MFPFAKHRANGRIIYRFSRASVPIHDGPNCISIGGGGNQDNEVTHPYDLHHAVNDRNEAKAHAPIFDGHSI